MASPQQKFCPEWSPAKGEKVVLDQKRGRDKILLGPCSSPHDNTCPPFHLGRLLLTSPIQNPQAPEAVSHLNNHSIPAMLQLRWLWIRKTVSFPPHMTEIPPFQFWNPFVLVGLFCSILHVIHFKIILDTLSCVHRKEARTERDLATWDNIRWGITCQQSWKDGLSVGRMQ